MNLLRKWLAWIPFGLFVKTKPRHFREILKVLWDNRGRWAYAWRILTRGVCDGCSLGPRGLRDDVIPGVHLCLTRLKLLKLNTIGPIPDARLSDLAALRRLGNEELHRLGRVPYPLVFRRGDAGFRRLSWEQALDRVACALRASKPDDMGMFLTSRGLTNETYYVAQKLARLAGTPHVDTCARLCHAASTSGLKETLGFAAPTLSLADWIGADLILIIGSNLPNNQPVSTKYLHAAKAAGSHIAVVNPFKEPALERYWIPSIPSSALFGTRLMDSYYAVRPGGDIAFLSGVLKALDELDGWDDDFLRARTTGSDALRAHLRELSFDELCADSGTREAEMRELAERYARAKTTVIVYSMGLTQYEFGVDNVKMVVNFALARGMVGRKNCGIMPIRGHSGVQGSAECGADAFKLPGGVDIDEDHCRRLEQAWGHPIPHRPGLRASHLLDECHQRGLDVLYLIGGNHLETMPDRTHAREALSNAKLRVHQDIVLNTSTLIDADEVIVLPAETRYEQRSGGTSTSTERRIRFSPEIAGPRIAEARPEWEILSLIGQSLSPAIAPQFRYRDTSQIREEMARVMPLYRGIETLKRAGDHVQWGGPQLGTAQFGTRDGKAHFSVVRLPKVELEAGRFMLTSRRGKQFNSLAYSGSDPLTGNVGRAAVIMAKEDQAAVGVKEGERVKLRSDYGELVATVHTGPCRRQHVQAFWPECNVLIGRRYDPVSGEPDYNTSVTIERI